jgi:hypothetical protein
VATVNGLLALVAAAGVLTVLHPAAALGGVAALATYGVLGALILTGHMQLSVALRYWPSGPARPASGHW